MDKQYKILAFNEAIGEVVVKFETPHFKDVLNIILPIEDDLYPEGEALDNYILGFVPYRDEVRCVCLERGVKNVDRLKALVEPPIEPTIDEATLAEEAAMREYESLQDVSREEVKEYFKLIIEEILNESNPPL